MRTLILFIVLYAARRCAFSQSYLRLSEASFQDLKLSGVKVNSLSSLKIGGSLGYNIIARNPYDLSINPVDKTLQLEKVGLGSVVLSTVILVSPKTFYLRKIKETVKKGDALYGSSKNTEGEIFSVPSKFSIGMVMNVAQFASETKVYNQKIDGGLGAGWRFSDNFSMLGSIEFNGIRQPRKYIIDQYVGKQLVINEDVVTSVNIDDNRIFINKARLTFSLKAVLVLNPSQTPESQVKEQ